MKDKKLLCLLLSGVMTASVLTGCTTKNNASKEETETTEESLNTENHEPLTLIDSGQDYGELIDLSGEEFSGNYNEINLDACSVDGANYLFPGDYSIQGIIYNKTLFEKNGWKMPRNFKELKELIPKIEEAGVQPSITMLSLPGYGFQYFCNVSSTMFLATKSGQKWIEDFQRGKADAETGLADCAKYFQQWIDCGLLNGDSDALAINECRNKFYEGNTAFLIGSMDRLTQNEDGSGDQYGLMPYLSPDGTENMYITSVRRYYGLNKHLEDPGNEQKLEDALHFMEVLSTEEGQKALEGNHASSVSPLKDSEIADDSPYKEAVEEIQKGHSTSAFYVGWEGVISDGGDAVADWICGSKTGEEVLAIWDSLESDHLQNGPEIFGTVENTLDTEQCAKLAAVMFGEASRAEVALISLNEWNEDVYATWENFFGINGRLFEGDITDEDLVAVLPTGWYDTIHTAELTGKEIRELEQEGFHLYSDDIAYPYILCVKNGEELVDDKTYTTVLCGDPEELEDAGRIQDTGIVGLDAAEEYLSQKGQISADDLEWK